VTLSIQADRAAVETGTMSPATARGAGIVGLTAGAFF